MIKSIYLALTILGLLLPASSETVVIDTPIPEATAIWDANTDLVTTGYVVSVGTSTQTYTQSYSVDLPTFVMKGLQFNTVYYVSVQAYSSVGLISPFSEEVSFKLNKMTQTYVIASTTRDGGKTWVTLGEIVVQPPIVAGQKYRLSLAKTPKGTITKTMVVFVSQDGGKTWKELGRIPVPPPIVKGQKYKIVTVVK